MDSPIRIRSYDAKGKEINADELRYVVVLSPIIDAILDQPYLVFTVIVERAEVLAVANPVDWDSVDEALSAVTAGVQGTYVRVSDGALVIYTSDQLSASDIELLHTTTGFAHVEVHIVDSHATKHK